MFDLQCRASVDEILTDLSSAADDWSDSIEYKGPKKTISISVPLLGISIGTEVELPDVAIGRSAARRMLVFVHQLTRPAFGLTNTVTKYAASRGKDRPDHKLRP